MTGRSGIPDQWFRLAVEGLDDEQAALVADLMVAEGGKAVVEEGHCWVTYLEPPSDPEGWAERFGASLRDALDRDCPVTWSWVAHRDWEQLWRTGLGPRRVGHRLVVAPSWDLPSAGANDIVLCIDPGMAFGTAEHATTRLALTLLEAAVRGGECVLDVGAGSGILSIAAIHLGAHEAWAVESDGIACAEARENAARNGAEARVRVEHRQFERAPRDRTFDGVLSNMVRTRLEAVLPGLVEALAPDGWIVLSGCEVHEAGSMVEGLAGRGFIPSAQREEEGWWGGLFRRRG